MFLLPSIIIVIALWVLFERGSTSLARITLTDMAIIAYLLHGLCNLMFTRDTPPDSLALCHWGMYTILYIVTRNVANKLLVTWLIIGIGITQAIIGITQLAGWFPSNHPDFPVTGTFQNPGPYGGLLAVSLIAIAWVLRSGARLKAFPWGVLLLLLVMLVISTSRAAWIAALVGIVTLFPRLHDGWGKRTIISIITGAFVVGLYFLRPGSADARILIWQVCARLIKLEPLTGLGIGTLPQHYMNAQAEYFAAHPDSDLSIVANNNYQAFNEFLHITVEQGFIGLLLLFGIILTCRHSSRFPFILTWFTFSMFSYPADCEWLMIVFVLSLALCAGENPGWCLKFNKKWFLCSLVMIPFTLATTLRYDNAVKNIKFDTAPQFPYNREYMLQFARQKRDIHVLERLTRDVCSSTDILCDMGDLYETRGDIKRADSCYSLARQMVPCRIKPLHKLYLLHKQRNSTVAEDYARQILNFKTPFVGSVVLRARADAKKFLNHE